MESANRPKTSQQNVTRVTRIKAGDRQRPLTPEEQRQIIAMRKKKMLQQQKLEEERRKEEEKRKKEQRLVVVGFVLSLLALLAMVLTLVTNWTWLTFVGLGLGIIDLIIFMPLIVKSSKRKKLPPKSGLFLAGCLLMAAGLVVNTILCIAQCVKQPEPQKEENYLEEVDVNGLTISVACETVRAKQWSVLEVLDENSPTNKSSCSDTQNKVTSTHYYQLNSASNPGKVTLYFSSAQQTTSNTTKSDSTTGRSSAETADKIDYNFRAMMDEYERFADEYVVVIRQHKADPSNNELLEKYNAMTVQYNEWVEKVNKVETSKLSKTDLEYYNTVIKRVSQKIAEAN